MGKPCLLWEFKLPKMSIYCSRLISELDLSNGRIGNQPLTGKEIKIKAKIKTKITKLSWISLCQPQ